MFVATWALGIGYVDLKTKDDVRYSLGRNPPPPLLVLGEI